MKGKTSARPMQRRDGGLVEEYVEDSLFLIDTSLGRIHHLNPMAAALWRQFEVPTSIDDVVELFRAAFPDVSRKKLRQEVTRLVRALAELELVIVGS